LKHAIQNKFRNDKLRYVWAFHGNAVLNCGGLIRNFSAEFVKASISEQISNWVYRLKYPFKLWVYELIDQWILFSIPYQPQKKILIYRLDLIGDYLMCRPFFSVLRKENRWKDFSFSFAGNQQVKDLAESLDSAVFHEFIWIDRARFINSWGYRFRILRAVRKAGFELVLYPSHTRQYWLESVVRVSGSAKVFTGEAVGHYMSRFEKSWSDHFYTSHISTGQVPLFEFYRNRNFFGHFSEEASRLPGLLDQNHRSGDSHFESGKMVISIAPGASTRNRRWPLRFFGELVHKLSEKRTIEVKILGGPGERALGEELIQMLPGVPIQNLAGKRSLTESMDELRNSHLLISNESSPVHMAATTGTPCIVISQGNHFGRWNPYPKDVAGWICTVYPASFGDVESGYKNLAETYHNGSEEDVAGISVDQVLEAVTRLIPGF
jgi:ADP-heptose:LPS heptosyltransferase